MFDKAFSLHQSGFLQEAIEIYMEVLQNNKNNPHLLFLLGTAHSQIGRHAEGIEYLQNSVKISPNPITYNNIAGAYTALNRHSEAIQFLRKAVALNPNYAEGFCNLGTAQRNAGFLKDSLVSLEEAIRLCPNYRQAFTEKGITFFDLERYSLSLECHINACDLDASCAETYKHIAVVLLQLGKISESISYLDKAIALKIESPDVFSYRGGAFKKLRRFNEALADYNTAVLLKPDSAEAYCNRGNTLVELHRYDEGLADYNRAIALKSDYAEAYCIRGHALKRLGRYDEALADYETAIRFKSDIKYLLGTMLHTKMQLCDWEGLQGSLALLEVKVRDSVAVSQPFELHGLIDSMQLQRKCAETHIASKYSDKNNPSTIAVQCIRRKIRIAYFSSDFGNHPVGHLVAGLFKEHDRSKFEVTAFSLEDRELDEWRQRVIEGVDHFIDVSKMSDSEISSMSRSMQIDIAIDLNGHTKLARTGIFSHRAAPIQTSYLGFLGTMGANYFDYLIADPFLIPEKSQVFYTEKIAYLPIYQCNDNKFEETKKIYSRKEFGLPGDAFVFCSFNNNWKITPSVFNSWMKILEKVQSSVLWVYVDNATAQANLKNEAKNCGIDPSRLVFASKVPLIEHLARQRLADLFLDTFPYNAGATASNALRVGLPVITRQGSSFASRYGASLLNAVGLPELITGSVEEFESLAIALAKDPDRLATVKHKLTSNLVTYPLFDTPRFVRSLESAFTEMYQRMQHGQSPDHIFISD